MEINLKIDYFFSLTFTILFDIIIIPQMFEMINYIVIEYYNVLLC